ncbi:hypothetical protein [Nocardioides aquiterrae]|uniref:Helix-turn-helix domain-containing protein n=1 Tax=Nocardioides aquiterrae TaxID=203799 RepID=A0ABN1UC43_9ACTN
MLRDRHLEGCENTHCVGCQPCPERHCRVCGDEHVTVDGVGTDQTCASCIGEVREDLTLIGVYAARLLGEAIVRGINSQAMVLDGPVARATTYALRLRRIIDGSACTLGAGCPFHGARSHGPTCRGDCRHRSCARINAPCPDAVAFNAANRDEPHPTWVVGTWEMKVRDHLGQPGDDAPTLTEARDYLAGHLTRLAHDPDFPFEQLGDDLEHCREHLESVLHDGDQVEKGAPCQRCKRPVLRTTADDGKVTYRCEHCARDLSETEYRMAVRSDHIANADRLNATDMAERTEVDESTIRRWASRRTTQRRGEKPVIHPPLLRSCGVDGKNRKVYRVSEVERIRDTGGDHRGTTIITTEAAS